MGFLDIFKKHKKDNLNINGDNDFFSEPLSRFGFIGSSVKSSNDDFLVGFRDHYYEGNRLIKGEIMALYSAIGWYIGRMPGSGVRGVNTFPTLYCQYPVKLMVSFPAKM